jgi:16S rRNA (guanine527-N7)-methyltransferase
MKFFDRAALGEVLARGIKELKLDLNDKQHEQLLDYLALLFKWNSVYNLTSVRDPMQMVTLHMLDSLAAVPAFAGAANVLDVGAGGGLPGIVLAIARPGMKVSLIDTVHKKTAFLTQVKAELELRQRHGVHHEGRAAAGAAQIRRHHFARFCGPVGFRELVRAFAGGGRSIYRLERHGPSEEQERLPKEWKVAELRPLQVPGLQAERHLVFIRKSE